MSRYLTATLRVTTALTEAPDADGGLRAAAADAVRRARLGRRHALAAAGSRRPARYTPAPGRRRAQAVPALEADHPRPGVRPRRGSARPGLAAPGPRRGRGPLGEPRLPAHGGRPRRQPAHRRGVPHPPRRHPAGRLRAVLPGAPAGARRARRRPGQRGSPDRAVPRPAARGVRRPRLAETLQRSLLPSHLPAIPGIQLAARYRAGRRSALSSAATPTTCCRWTTAAGWCSSPTSAAPAPRRPPSPRSPGTPPGSAAASGSPSEVLCAVNTALLHEQSGPLRFVTACCLVLEPPRGRPPGRAERRRTSPAAAPHGGRQCSRDRGPRPPARDRRRRHVRRDDGRTGAGRDAAALHRRRHRGPRRRRHPVRREGAGRTCSPR